MTIWSAFISLLSSLTSQWSPNLLTRHSGLWDLVPETVKTCPKTQSSLMPKQMFEHRTLQEAQWGAKGECTKVCLKWCPLSSPCRGNTEREDLSYDADSAKPGYPASPASSLTPGLLWCHRGPAVPCICDSPKIHKELQLKIKESKQSNYKMGRITK